MSKKPFSDLSRRLVVALVGIPAVIAVLWWLPYEIGVTAVGILAAGGVFELGLLTEGQKTRRFIFVNSVLTGGVVAGSGLAISLNDRIVPLFLAALILGLIIWILRGLRPGDLSTLSFSFLGLLWIGLPLAVLNNIFISPRGSGLLTLLLATVWIGDTAAYAVGTALGRRLISPGISPKKTVEGTIAGIAASAAVVVGAGPWFEWEVGERLILGICLGIAALLGDLAESKLKRLAGVKDSGVIFGSHGGILDRLDALLVAIAVLSIFLAIKG